MDKILYFVYVVLTSFRHGKKLLSFSRIFHERYKKSIAFFIVQAYSWYMKWNVHPLDYFYFNIYKNIEFDPQEHANTLFMYRYHKKLNQKPYTKYFSNKILFHKKFKHFMGHDFISLKQSDIDEVKKWIRKKDPEYLIIKKIKSVGGFGVKKISVQIMHGKILIDNESLEYKFNYLRKFDLMEEFVYQHESINKLNPSCLNTIRIVTVLDKSDNVNIIGSVIRLGVNNVVDNFHSGGIAVKISTESGCLEGEGFRLAPSVQEYFVEHPITKIKFDGYQLPHWNLLIDTVKKASLVIPECRTIGWDLAITEDGVRLIEGNHDWDKIIIEKALKRGIRKELEKYL